MNKFNAKKETKQIISFIQDYYKENNLKGVVIGISGGKDSGVVAGLFAKALGGENVLGVTMPCHSKESDKTDASLVSEKYGFELINFDLTNIYDSFINEKKKLGNFTDKEENDSNINLKPRLRMSTLYYLAALYSKIKNGVYLVAGTSNKCELYVGYFTKGGDSTHDISVISDFTVEEVIEIGKYIEVPEKVLFKTPDDGLSNQSDEEKLGVTYKEIADYMIDENKVNEHSRKTISDLHRRNSHKFNIPTYRR
jgi:NAD+ synthase